MLPTRIRVNIWILNRNIPVGELRSIPYLFLDLATHKYILQCNIKLAQVVLAKPVMVPTDAFQQWDAPERHFKRHVPFRV